MTDSERLYYLFSYVDTFWDDMFADIDGARRAIEDMLGLESFSMEDPTLETEDVLDPSDLDYE